MRGQPLSNVTTRYAARTAIGILAASILVGCAACGWNRTEVVYVPVERDDWVVSTPEAEGLDPALVDRLYSRASRAESTLGVLVIRNGALIAEAYFNGCTVDTATLIQSATKSVASALTGIAISQGYLEGVNQRAMEFFPELADQITDSRKYLITIRQMLQMRAGFLWEEASPELFDLLYSGFHPRNFADVPLARAPATAMQYSNLTSYLLGVIVARATGTDLRTYAQENLFDPIGVEIYDWNVSWEGYYPANGDLWLTARDMARFGQLYLDGGVYDGNQVVPAEWVQASLVPYSRDAWPYRIGRNFADISYGYQWWSARAGDQVFWFAWGHGGQVIALVPEENMVVVVKADSLWGEHGDRAWRLERENLNLVGDFIRSLQ